MGDKVQPASKPVSKAGGIKDGANSTLTTPKKDSNKYWGPNSYSANSEKIMK